MNRLGIQSLNAGAPDLRLSGDQTQRGTYVQRRRAQMAGGGITQIGKPGGLVEPGISKYGALDFITKPLKKVYDKVVDDLIPNEIKDSPAGAALVGGALINQFGLIPGMGGGIGDFGKNWLGNLLGGRDAVLGEGIGQDFGDPLINFGASLGIVPNKTPDIKQSEIDKLTGGGINPADPSAWEQLNKMANDPTGALTKAALEQFSKLPTTSTELSPFRKALATVLPFGDPGYVEGGLYNQIFGALGSGDDGTGSGTSLLRQAANIGVPMAIGAAAGKMQQDYLDKQPAFPADETGITFQTAAEAMANPNLRFKPQAQYANVAEGGRIGAQEGGLMNLGGMEKDYRNEGGFVPIGAEEKADDVPARLSKNEFVFTADAVRAAGGGDIDRGAEVMENLMENLEGARGMYANTQKLQNRII